LAANNNAPFLTAHRLALFPDSTRIRNDSLAIAGQELSSLAEEYGTPLYLYDRATLDACSAEYKDGLQAYYPARAEVTYAGKAFLCKAIAEWTQLQKLWLDCTGSGEIGTAKSAGVTRERILVHGVNKSIADLESAIKHAGTIVVDNLTELVRIADLYSNSNRIESPQRDHRTFPDIWLRLQPGIAVETHHTHTQTGQQDSKFGMTPDEINEAALICRSAKLPLAGLHFHQGSNFRNHAPLLSAIEMALDLVGKIGFDDTWHFCPGGGWGAAYHEDELPTPDINDYVRVIAEKVVGKCRISGLTLPILHVEPGRSLIARAGVALYRVGTVKRREKRTWLLTDGGMTDNPRHALYGAKYSCLPVTGINREISEQVTIAGPYCESGDVIIEDLPMPRVEEGELIAIPVSGAYHMSMSSNYNGSLRPAVVWLEEGKATLIVRRETREDLSLRDLSIS
jgi:diaminopimelate decarboxylase